MSKPDVKSWLQSTEGTNLLDKEDDFSTFTLEGALNDWPSFLSSVQAHVLSSRTKIRISFLNNVLLAFSKNSGM